MDGSTPSVGTPGGGAGVSTGSREPGYGRLAQKPRLGFGTTVARLSSVPSGAFLFGESSHKRARTYTYTYTFTQLCSCTTILHWAFPADLLNLASTQELAIERVGRTFIHLTLLVTTIVKVINGEEEDRPLLFPLCAITP